MYEQILEKKQCISKKDLALNGRDLIDMGMETGKQLGEVLDELFEMVLEDPQLNTREKLTEIVNNIINPLI